MLKSNANSNSQLRALENLSKQPHLSHLHGQLEDTRIRIESSNVLNDLITQVEEGETREECSNVLADILTHVERSFIKTHFIIGPGIKGDRDSVRSAYAENGHSLIVHGDGKSPVDIGILDLSEATNIIIDAHGARSASGHFYILLGKPEEPSGAWNIFTNIASSVQNKPVNLIIYACHAGAAIKYINLLPTYSTLMTFIASSKIDSSYFFIEFLEKIESYPKFNTNPFIKFAAYLLINPEDNNFIIRTPKVSIAFGPSIDDLKDYSLNGLREWREQQLKKFHQFLEYIRPEVSELQQAQIDQAREELLLEFNVEHY